MLVRKIGSAAAVLLVAMAGVALTGSQAIAGSTTYSVEIAPNGDGACNTNTGGVSNVTHNGTSAPITIQCNLPNGLAWGRNLDTPDANATSAQIVDDGTTVALGWTPGAMNSSHGRALGLGLRIGDMSVKSTAIDFFDPSSADDAAFTNTLNGSSRRANLKAHLPMVPSLQNGTVSCTAPGENPSFTWSSSTGTRAFLKNFAPLLKVLCPSPNSALSLVRQQSSAQKMSNVSGNTKLMSASYTCSNSGEVAVAGGYDISGSTTSQWPQVVFNGPDSADSSGATWKVMVAVPSQSSSAAQAVLTVFATCKS